MLEVGGAVRTFGGQQHALECVQNHVSGGHHLSVQRQFVIADPCKKFLELRGQFLHPRHLERPCLAFEAVGRPQKCVDIGGLTPAQQFAQLFNTRSLGARVVAPILEIVLKKALELKEQGRAALTRNLERGVCARAEQGRQLEYPLCGQQAGQAFQGAEKRLLER